MFDLENESSTHLVKNKKGADIFDHDGPATVVSIKPHPMDSEENIALHGKLISYYRQELDRQAPNRYEMAIDEDYFDSIQWDEESAAILRQRGQAPLVYNVTATSVRWVLGTEKQARTDFKVLPRRKEDGTAAERKSSLLKYLNDINRLPFSRSRAFKDSVVVGIGWREVGIQDEADSEEMIYGRYESWRNMLWDSSATDADLSDARYQFRNKWVDVDAATALLPDRKAQIESAAVESNRFSLTSSSDVNGDEAMDFPEYSLEEQTGNRAVVSHRRRRVRLIEGWFKVPSREKRITKGPWKGQIYDGNDQRHTEYIESLAERLTYVMHYCIMTPTDMLHVGRSPYRHNRFPFIPVWGYRRGRDGLPYGMIRGLRDIQDDINKRAAKAQFVLATNKIVADDDAFKDLETTRSEAARPDGIILKKRGSDVKLDTDRALADAHLNLMQMGIQMIQQVGGVTDELLARKTNAVSGVAIERRQSQGSLVVSDFFDNLLFSDQIHGEIWLSLIEQFMTEQKQFRITNMRGKADFVEVNSGLPDDDITRTKADFIMSEADYRASVRQSQTDQLIEIIAKLAPYNPQLALVMLDLIVESMDIHNRDEIVKRIRKLTGQSDPDATEPSEEELQAQDAEAQQQMFQQKLAQANLRKTEAEAAVKEASAIVAQNEAALKQAQTVSERVSAQQQAIQGSTAIAAAPAAAPIADHILKQAGQDSQSTTQ
ncbi:MAG: hypothetical protein Q7S87_04725 [Agitococcus sp.]|nr:hypothetical protein [Agitococcus sp.]